MTHNRLEDLKIAYIFEFPDGKSVDFHVLIDAVTRTIRDYNRKSSELVSWTALDFCQCTNCPLDPGSVRECPVASILNALVEAFEERISYEEITVDVVTPQRTYSKKTSVQYGLQSLYGLMMAASGCPNLEFLSPMALFHLPFADMRETLMRTVSFHLLGYFLKNMGKIPEKCSLQELKEKYHEVEKVNDGILRRIRSREKAGDANHNALVALNTFAQTVSLDDAYILNSLGSIFL